MGAPTIIDGQEAKKFRSINENILLPLALDYRKNQNDQSLKKALYIYDWFNDQGWADGSSMGTLCFEKLRSSGYFHSFFLLKEQLFPNPGRAGNPQIQRLICWHGMTDRK